MPDYQKAKIYKIVDANEEMVYVGSTVNTLARRMATHRGHYKSCNFVSSHIIFDKYGVENCKILLLENYPCNTKDELNRREGEHIKQLNCVNKQIAGRTNHEYYEDNKEAIIDKQKKYYELNNDKRVAIRKKYNDANREAIAVEHKIYREKNKELLKEKRKEKRVS